MLAARKNAETAADRIETDKTFHIAANLVTNLIKKWHRFATKFTNDIACVSSLGVRRHSS